MPNINVKRLMRKSAPSLRKIAGENKQQYLEVKACVNDIFEDMKNLYDKGKTHNLQGLPQMERSAFSFWHGLDDAKLPEKDKAELIEVLFGAYKDGYNSKSKC